LKPANEELKSLLSFSLIVFIANIIQFLAYRIDFWLIDHFYTAADVGIYAQANRFAQLIWLLPVIISALLPPLMRGEHNFFNDEAFLQIVRILNFITLVIVGSVVVIAIAFYHWFFQNEYSRGLGALLLMLPGYFLFATATLLAAWFSVKRLLKINLIGSCLCFVVILVADLILIPRYSLDGAGLANTIAYSTTTLYFILQFKWHKSVGMKELFLCKKEDIIVIKRLII
jgi:O-antigen/teichoic acid export membrane protein